MNLVLPCFISSSPLAFVHKHGHSQHRPTLHKTRYEQPNKKQREETHSRVVLIPITILLVVQLLGLLLGVVADAVAVDEAEALGLDQLVGLGGGQGGDGFLGEAVADGFALLALLLLPQVHGLEGDGAADQFVGEPGLVLF